MCLNCVYYNPIDAHCQEGKGLFGAESRKLVDDLAE